MTTSTTPLQLRIESMWVRVLLDYKAAKNLFYNMTSQSCIYTTDVIFAEPVYPLFHPGIYIDDTNVDQLSACHPQGGTGN